MEYTIDGEGDTLVVLICGLGAKNYIWEPMKKSLVTSCRVCSIELSEELNTDKISKKIFNILKKILKWVELGKQINIVGWSLGGMVAQKLSTKMIKKKISVSLTLIATTHSFSILRFLRNLSLYKSFNIIASIYSKNALANSLVDLNYPHKESRPKDVAECFEQMMQPDACYYFLFQVVAIITHFLTQEEIELLKKIKPLIIAGELDEILPYKMSLETAKLFDVPLIIIPNSGHALMNQKPQEVFAAFYTHIF